MIGQLIVEGLAIGACYGLFAIAFVIIYKTSDVINFAQGEMAMLSTFVAYHILTFYNYPFYCVASIFFNDSRSMDLSRGSLEMKNP